MARYRVGDSYLSQKEYDEHLKSNRKVKYFIYGFLVTLFLLMFPLPKYYPGIFDVDKTIKFIVIISLSILVGWICSKYSNFLENVLAIFILTTVILLAGAFVWRVI